MVQKDLLNQWKGGLWKLLIPIGVICLLILKDNFSTAALLFLICFILLFIGKVPFLKLLTIVGACIGSLALIVGLHLVAPKLELLHRFDTWMHRISSMSDGEEEVVANAQAMNAKLAIYNGGVFGQGVGDGKLKEYLPEAYADFYYSSYS